MSSGLYSHTTRGTGTVLTAAIYNADHANHITNQNPTMTGAHADSVAQYQANVDPGGIGSEVLPTNLAGEIERLRFAIKRLTGKAQWYAAPAANFDQVLNGINPALIAIAAAAGIPLTLRLTDNDTVERTIQALESGSGGGTDFLFKIKGDGANGVDSIALFKGATELLRLPETRFRWQPMGYLTPTAGVPIIPGDVSGATSVIYEPYIGNVAPVIKGGIVHMREFSALTLSLDNPNHAANTLYDIFLDDDAGTLKLSTGAAWSNSGAGTGARGAGGSTTELTRLQGFWVNANSMTVRNGAATRTLAASAGIYLGTLLIDGAGTVSCLRGFGQNRKWGVWNAFNRVPIILKAGDGTASWPYNLTTVRASNNDSNNKNIVMCGLAEEPYEHHFIQHTDVNDNTNNTAQTRIGIGLNSITAYSGTVSDMQIAEGASDTVQLRGTLHAGLISLPALGVQHIQCLESVPQASLNNPVFGGTETFMSLTSRWRV